MPSGSVMGTPSRRIMISLTPYLAFRPAPRMIRRVSYPPFLDSDCTPGIPDRASFRPNILVSLISSLVTTLTPAGISSVARSVLVAVTTTSSRSIFFSFGCSACTFAHTRNSIAISNAIRVFMIISLHGAGWTSFGRETVSVSVGTGRSKGIARRSASLERLRLAAAMK